MYIPMERDVRISGWCHSDYMAEVGNSLDLSIIYLSMARSFRMSKFRTWSFLVTPLIFLSTLISKILSLGLCSSFRVPVSQL